ncbi:MAG: hypothetical protein RL150_400 [Candidatus Parcubacteria bacterium]|jgi:hypothetical protein
MRLPYFAQFRKWVQGISPQALPIFLILGSVTFSYAVGLLEGVARGRPPIAVIKTPLAQAVDLSSVEGAGQVVASKMGTTFYYPWCSGRSRIKPENERWFESSEEALKYGLKPAKNCLGL